MAQSRVFGQLAAELGLPAESVEATVALLREGATAPFLAAYRKERAGGLDDRHICAIAESLQRLNTLERRKTRAVAHLKTQGVLTDALREQIAGCTSRWELDDVCLPYRTKRRTRGALAKERGLEPLAEALRLRTAEAIAPEELALPYVNAEREVPDAQAALEGARHILAEQVAENTQIRRQLRQIFGETSVVRTAVVEGKAAEHSKYEMYYGFSEPASAIPSHRVLAIRRGEKEGWLTVTVEADRERAMAVLREAYLPPPECPTAPVLDAALADAYDRLLATAFEADVRADLKRRADAEAISVFTSNLCGLLLQPPAGPRRTLGVEPGYRTGCKLAVIDADGKLLEHTVVFPHPPQAQADEASATARALLEKHQVEAVAIGNGTASRETDLFFREALKQLAGRKIARMVVNEAGVNTYATSRAARDEFPDLETGLRSAVGIARRFQDPLAELVQLDPRTIGVGQYQHDVNQQALREALEGVVQHCVCWVGVDVNRASVAQLAHVAGIDRATAHDIVEHRKEHGPFRALVELMGLARFDECRYQQAAGFLRVYDGDQPLDATGIHPERYELVARIAADAGTDVATLLGNQAQIDQVDFPRYIGDEAGEPTLRDICRHLRHPGADPRGAFRTVEFRDDITAVEDIKAGMVLEGTVTNVTNFGAFVDIGVQEDGLVHVSQLARRYVKDPVQAVQVGDIVKVKVLSVDSERRRIGLSIKQAAPPRRKPRPKKPSHKPGQPQDRPAGQAQGQKQGRRSGQGKTARPAPPKKPKRDRTAKATPEEIARLVARFQRR